LLRDRSTKALARHVELHYIDVAPKLRLRLKQLTWAGAILALSWPASLALLEKDYLYSAGPVAPSHSLFANDCFRCHTAYRSVSEASCLSCHDGPIHHKNQKERPLCGSCHKEHERHARLDRPADAHCLHCHADLQTSTGKPRFATRITSLRGDHPELAVLRTKKKDPARLALNHEKHLQVGLKGLAPHLASLRHLEGWQDRKHERDRMLCTDCHLPDATRLRMAPISYTKHCATCHPLEYDPRFKGDVLPHDTPEVIHRFLVARLTEHVEEHPELLKPAAATDEDDDRRRPRGEPSPPAPTSPAAWVKGQVEFLEDCHLSKAQTCKLCHALEVAPAGEGTPVAFARRVKVVPTAVPDRWLAHARFDHWPHRPLDCTSCHAGVRTSRLTSDVNLPGIAKCQTCHGAKDGPPSTCSTCHLYHDKTRDRGHTGTLALEGLQRPTRQTPPAR
jgi:hypothetical protein